MSKSPAKSTHNTTSFSEFIRNAKSAEKKRVYATVLKKSTEKQNEMLEKSALVQTG